MTVPERRLAELERISRERPLTEAEQAEVMLRANQHRRNEARRRQYRRDPEYRQACLERSRATLAKRRA